VQVFLPNLRRFGGDFALDVRRRGYFPRGGGRVILSVQNPVQGTLKPIQIMEQVN